jgi:regulator of sirC expression with transglutaminase-like and TPR domain
MLGPGPGTIEATLSELGSMNEDEFNAPRAALYLAALDNPGIELARYEAHLDQLAAATAERSNVTPCDAIAGVVASLYGYRGDSETYDDMRNADLIQVIDRRRGLPVALGLLYTAAASGLNAKLVGLAFPGHFLMRLESDGERVIIDPFNQGRTCTSQALRKLAKGLRGNDAELEPGYFAPVSARAMVIRLLMNIRIRALKAGRRERAIEIVRRMTLVAPGDAQLWADLAELHAAHGNLAAAREAFTQSIANAPTPNFRKAAEAALQSVTLRLN